MFGFKIITQYEKGIVFRFGRALPGIRGAGLTWVNPFTSRLHKVNMQIVVAAVPGQEAITRDNVTLRVDAVVYYRVIDPLKAIINVQNYKFAVSQVAQTSLRSVIGQSDMDQLLSERQKINAHLKDVIDAPTEQPWGIRVERVEVKDVALPESMNAQCHGRPKPNGSAAPGSSPPTANTRHPRNSPKPPPSWPPTRPPCSYGYCKPSSRSPPRRTAPWSCPSRSNCCASSTVPPRPPARLSPRPPAPRTQTPRCRCPNCPPSQCQPAPPRPPRSTPPKTPAAV